MSSTIKLTTKRQATFPAKVCEQLGLKPGDEIDLKPRVDNGKQLWVLQKRCTPPRPWLGSLRAYAKNASGHSIKSMRDSIVRSRAPKL